MQQPTGISSLIFKYLRKDLTTEENDQLQQWISQSDKNRTFFEEVTQPGHLFEEAQDRELADREIDAGALWQKLISGGLHLQPLTFDQPLPTTKQLSTRRIWYAAAAILLLLVAGGGYFLLNHEPNIKETVAAPTKQQPVSNDVAAGTRAVSLTLHNGTVIELNDRPNGVLATESATAISKKTNDQLVYTVTGNATDERFNTLTVPKGGKPMQVTLGDGTIVLLNAASSLQYPVAFTGDERKVNLLGEAWFEVAHNPARPFKVMKGKLEIAVLGTKFNVQAYNDEDAIKVTLLEGSVKLANGDPAADDAEQVTLKPGEQAVVDSIIGLNVDKNVDKELVMAWKNGLFYFENTDIEVVIRELARWYDVTIDCDKSLKGSAISGQIARNSNLSEVLAYLKTAEFFDYKIQDRKVTLTPFTK